MILTNFPWTTHWGLQTEKYKTAPKAFCLACVYFFSLLSVGCVFWFSRVFFCFLFTGKEKESMNNGSWKQKVGNLTMTAGNVV